jgi:acyl-CoA reductase-like NAD-dependent aldehyde dehydrogenase
MSTPNITGIFIEGGPVPGILLARIGPGARTGAALVAHPKVRFVTSTG